MTSDEEKKAKALYRAGVKAYQKAAYIDGYSPLRAALWALKVASGLKKDA